MKPVTAVRVSDRNDSRFEANRNTCPGQDSLGRSYLLFYETKQDLFDALGVYFKAGLQENEFCLWAISDPITEQEGRDALVQGVPDFERHLAQRRLEFLPGRG